MNPDSHMDPDEFQQAWHADESQTRVTVDADLLQKELHRNQQTFFAQIRRRDAIEIGVGLLLLPFWFYKGATGSLPWTWYLTVPAILWIIGFFLVDRIRHPQTPSDPDEPLLNCVKNSLTQVEHQIWLLRNIFWWYLLPPTLSILAFFSHVAWLASENWLDVLSHTKNFVFLFIVYYFVYWLNQRAVDSDLEPRRQELLALLANLGEEPISDHVSESSGKSTECSKRLRRWAFATATCIVTLIVAAMISGIFDSSYVGTPQSSGPTGDSLANMVAEQRKEKNLVGLAAMVMQNGKVEAVAVQGERRHGSNVPLKQGDRWHLGGITKAITTMMIARVVESGQMQWSDTIGEIFPEDSINEDWKPVTLRQLVTDTAGVLKNFNLGVRLQQPALGPECTQARRKAVLDVLAEKPIHTPGEKFAYSNVGITIAGAMAEKVTGESWSELVEQEVFEPLKLTGAGFGPPKSPDPTPTNPGLDQPRGHRIFFGGKIAVGDNADNTPIMGPGATAHMTLNDLCTFATHHLRGELGEDGLLSSETYQLLHTPELDDYAFGWAVKEPTYDLPYKVFWHNGSNTMWYALVVFIPDKKLVVAVTSNDGDIEKAQAAAWEIVNANAKQFNMESDIEQRKNLPTEAFPKKSPFSGVRWQESQPEVKIGQRWFKLESLDEIPSTEIVAFSRRTYGEQWRKRFEEDLVELLARMGHLTNEKVKLVVQSLETAETQTFEEISMTEENRKTIWNAARNKTSP